MFLAKIQRLSLPSNPPIEVSTNPITPVKQSTIKQTEFLNPDGKRSSECGAFVETMVHTVWMKLLKNITTQIRPEWKDGDSSDTCFHLYC
jgi:hypothetical protein